MPRPAERFETQASSFDRRAGVDAGVGHAAALAVAEVLDPAGPDVVVEIGAGTGGIGRHLAEMPVRYIGVDSAAAMLEVFCAKLHGRAKDSALLVRADLDVGWPVRDAGASVVLASRVAHLLRPDHLVDELTRVCRPGGAFLVGRVKREPFSVKTRLRHQRETILRRLGFTPAGGAEVSRALLDRLVAGGATPLPTRRIISWPVRASADDILSGWDSVTAMGGVDLPTPTRVSVLAELREWAAGQPGGLGQVQESIEHYTFDGVRVGPGGGPPAPGGPCGQTTEEDT